jgi:hypothetical protein
MPINYLAVVVAAVAGFALGWGWYTVFGKAWMAALGKSKEDCDKEKQSPMPLIIAGVLLSDGLDASRIDGPPLRCHG